ncbi:MAG TPA: hypothetical protein VJ742_07170, partial [Nitrososphaera sp.]|nr:hypothetical protein [Nitrososphaera sp.]
TLYGPTSSEAGTYVAVLCPPSISALTTEFLNKCPNIWKAGAPNLSSLLLIRAVPSSYLEVGEGRLNLDASLGLQMRSDGWIRPVALETADYIGFSAHGHSSSIVWSGRTPEGSAFTYRYWEDLVPDGVRFGLNGSFSFPALGRKGPSEYKVPSLKAGSFVLITDPSKIQGVYPSGKHLLNVPAKCMTDFDSSIMSVGTIEIIGAGSSRAHQLNVPRAALSPAPEPWFMPEEKVEVSLPVIFRKKQLQGLRGKIVLYPDREGDVGVEFSEDLGAGSLDGLGTDGRCLFIPAKALKKI